MASSANSARVRTRIIHRWWVSAVAGCLLAPALASGCTETRDQGSALLFNHSGQAPLQIVIHNQGGRPTAYGTIDEVGYQFDTENSGRDRRCLVARDGGFIIYGTHDEVIVEHSFADREVCELDEIILKEDGSLEWK